jgi:hypothetical protein
MWISLKSVALGHPAGLFAIGLAAIGLLHAAVALGRARQWYVLPVLFGLTALAGFLLNPFADASTALDLRLKLTSFEALTLLCIAQLILVAVSLWFGMRIDIRSQRSPSELGLAVIHAIPAPMVLIAMLLVEQSQLAMSAGARPEAVGRQVGLTVATALTLGAIVAMLIPRRHLAAPHFLLSVAMILACMFVPVLQDPLPRPLGEVDVASLGLLWKFVLVAVLFACLGCCRRPMTLDRPQATGTLS